jgi:isoquinoline 1-oxidoreductase
MDRLEFRIKNSGDERLIAVLKSAAQSFGWNRSKTTGHGHGVACGFEKGGYVGTVRK